ncbi:MAG: hypothetical protein JWL62_3901 [Hyphomicrobiales bacterium]|nr:hypothetical protein [Hyphomicrobiales bacterium]
MSYDCHETTNILQLIQRAILSLHTFRVVTDPLVR